jgi:hypothetical protein
MQFSLKWLLIAVAFAAVCLVAMLNANELWQNAFRTAVLFSVLVALIGAVASVAATRLFCVGYTIVALLFFTNFFGASWASELITQNILSDLHSRAFPFTEEKIGYLGPQTAMNYDGDIVGVPVSNSDGSATILVVRPRKRHFVEVGHAALSVALGVVGGIIAVAFYRRRPTGAAQSASAPCPPRV